MSKPAKSVTPQGQPQEVIGGGIAAGVVAQIMQREELKNIYYFLTVTVHGLE